MLTTGVAGASAQESIEGAGNLALIKPDATAEVLARTKDICEEVFSYNYADLDGTRERVADLTTDRFQEQYDELFGEVIEQAPSRQAVLTTKVVEAAARYLTDEDAKVLVYFDQTNSTAGGGATGGASMFLASLRKVDNEWLLDEVDMFGADQ